MEIEETEQYIKTISEVSVYIKNIFIGFLINFRIVDKKFDYKFSF